VFKSCLYYTFVKQCLLLVAVMLLQVPAEDNNYHAELFPGPWRQDIKPLDVMQPEVGSCGYLTRGRYMYICSVLLQAASGLQAELAQLCRSWELPGMLTKQACLMLCSMLRLLYAPCCVSTA
jgi:hypothetical protein